MRRLLDVEVPGAPDSRVLTATRCWLHTSRSTLTRKAADVPVRVSAARYAAGLLVMVFGVVRRPFENSLQASTCLHGVVDSDCPLQILPLAFAFLRKSRPSLKRTG